MQPIQTTPSPAASPQMTPPQSSATPTEQQVRAGGAPTQPTNQYVPINYGDPTQMRMERRGHNQAAGIPVWGILLILVGFVALFGNMGIGFGWIFGLALGAWFVYLGLRHAQEGRPVNWWLVGLGLLIGLGAISTGFVDKLIFPIVLVLVGIGILGEHYLSGQNQRQ